MRIDAELHQKAKIMNINVSALVNDVLRGILAHKGDFDKDIYQIEKRIKEIREQKSKLSVEENELLAQKLAHEEKNKHKKDQEFKDLLKKAEIIKRSGVLERA